ncbi:alanyl-tRNA editing protein [Nocardioides bigeumensis]|jgi:misacylated tRNA(Ala) deacylase|uniref:Alanyl-tRNA editing protein AlaXM n=1 Tax=Nocardioides bigeumensis TaxID=433657 RepID=A0ABP5KK02_9ACTN
MGVPGNPAATAPPELAASELFAVDAYVREFEATVVEVDREGRRVRLDRTAFYPGGGGQPHDLGTLSTGASSGSASYDVISVKRDRGPIWHTVSTGSTDDEADLPDVGTQVHGILDWQRRHTLMRTHTALHVLCGVIWADYGIPVTGGNMEPGKGRLDFPFPHMSADLGVQVERRINEEIAKALEIVVDFVPRATADTDPALIRTAANLIPLEVDPLRVIDILGLDRQADGGTHVVSTADVGDVRVSGTESKGKDNKRIRIELTDQRTEGATA